MRIIRFDNNITGDCPKSDIGTATSDDCLGCDYFKGFHGFDAHCIFEDLIDMPEKELQKLKT